MERIVNRNALAFSVTTVAAGGNGAKGIVEMQGPDPLVPPPSRPYRDPYRGVVLVLFVAALLGTAGAMLLDVAITMGLATCILAGIATAQSARAWPGTSEQAGPETSADAHGIAETQSSATIEPSVLIRRLKLTFARSRRLIRNLGVLGTIRVSTAVAGTIALLCVLMFTLPQNRPDPLLAGIVGAVCLLAAGLAAIAAHYLGRIAVSQLPEASGLCRGSRLMAWILGAAALSMGLALMEQQTILRVLYFALFLVNVALCYGLFTAQEPVDACCTIASRLSARTSGFEHQR